MEMTAFGGKVQLVQVAKRYLRTERGTKFRTKSRTSGVARPLLGERIVESPDWRVSWRDGRPRPNRPWRRPAPHHNFPERHVGAGNSGAGARETGVRDV
jgi:hypothetical protein